jgi:hypothetical protein
MRGFLAAHGYDPGPTQRPFTAGAICGIIAAFPAVGCLWLFGSLRVEAQILQLTIPATLALGWVAMAIAGAVYARWFGRAANDRHGGWLFGMIFGFALWAAGAVLVLPLLSGGHTPAGWAAIGVLASLLVWGLGLGAAMPIIHPHLHERLESGAKSAEVGPSAGTKEMRARSREGVKSPR